MPLLGAAFTKLVQRKAYDLLSLKYGFVGALVAAGLLVTTGFLFGEAVFTWSSEKYAAVFNSYQDNLVGKSFQTRLCSPLPIDVVYTWVNGSDPRLLAELRLLKATMEAELASTTSPNASVTKCTYAHCVRANSFILPGQRLSDIMTLDQLKVVCESCAAVSKLEALRTDDSLSNITILYFDYAANFSAPTITNRGAAYTFVQGYYTSDLTIPNSVVLHDTVLVSGFKQQVNREQLEKQLPEKARSLIREVQVFEAESIAVILTHTIQDATTLLGMASNVTLGGHQLVMNLANLVYSLSYVKKSEDVSASRYEDNDELRYSLRSLEKHAPWVRRVYVVTNGQIPYWLNLENPRVTIVTHEEIFLNKSHLPTFSSPAIESHLHRIPGLSEKFIYMNDDVMFGQIVWPDDFYTHSRGQKVHLTWSIPDCSPGCPQSWIRDGYCDKPCNNSACQFDGGDCEGGRPAFGHGGSNAAGANNWHDNWLQNSVGMCRTGCSNHWIADKYCDQTCNVKECGFDAGDCGATNFHNLPMYFLSLERTEYNMLLGDTVSYFNTSAVFKQIDEAHYVEDRLLRVAVISNKHKVMTVILYNNHNTSVLSFNLTGKSAITGRTLTFAFKVAVESHPQSWTHVIAVNDTMPSNISDMQPELPAQEQAFRFEDVAENERKPVAATMLPMPADSHILESMNSSLPVEVYGHIKELEKLLEEGLLTMKGYKLKRSRLMYEALHWSTTARRIDSTVSMPPLQSHTRGYKGDANDATAAAAGAVSAAVVGDGHANRKLLSLSDGGFLPWERVGTFDRLVKALDAKESQLAAVKKYSSRFSRGTLRHLLALDTFAESLHHVNRLYNAAFGYASRKVIGHIAHMIDKRVMEDLQNSFSAEWDATSSHKVRSGTDMQFAFAYFHFVMSAKRNNTIEEFINQLDSDGSGVLSDREIRTLATRLFEAPLDLQSLVTLEQQIINCSQSAPNGSLESNGSCTSVPNRIASGRPPKSETYYDTAMPQVTLELLCNCVPVVDLIKKKIKPAPKYKFETVGEEEITFKMIGTNLSTVVGQLDDIRRNTRKFICLNDNIDHHHHDAANIKALLQDFYESIFPLPSQFELPVDYRNRYLHVSELAHWKKQRWSMKMIAVGILIFVTAYASLCFCSAWLRRSCRRRRRTTEDERSAPEESRVGMPGRTSLSSV